MQLRTILFVHPPTLVKYFLTIQIKYGGIFWHTGAEEIEHLFDHWTIITVPFDKKALVKNHLCISVFQSRQLLALSDILCRKVKVGYLIRESLEHLCV